MTRPLEQALDASAPALVAIGASSGALEALLALLPALPGSLPIPGRRRARSRRPAQRPADGACGPISSSACERPKTRCRSSRAPCSSRHPTIIFWSSVDGTLSLSAEPPVQYLAAVDRRAFRVGGRSVQGAGCSAFCSLAPTAMAPPASRPSARRGGLTWVQSPASATMAAMPEAALALASHEAAEPRDMGSALAEWSNRGR